MLSRPHVTCESPVSHRNEVLSIAYSKEFVDFVRDVVNLSAEMAPAVAEAIRQRKWKISPNPLGAIRTASHQEAKRLGIQ
jgi:hypothetical protein